MSRFHQLLVQSKILIVWDQASSVFVKCVVENINFKYYNVTGVAYKCQCTLVGFHFSWVYICKQSVRVQNKY